MYGYRAGALGVTKAQAIVVSKAQAIVVSLLVRAES